MNTKSIIASTVAALVLAASLASTGCAVASAEDVPQPSADEPVGQTAAALSVTSNCGAAGDDAYVCTNRELSFGGGYMLFDNLNAMTDEKVTVTNVGDAAVDVYVTQLFGTSSPITLTKGQTTTLTRIDDIWGHYAARFAVGEGVASGAAVLHAKIVRPDDTCSCNPYQHACKEDQNAGGAGHCSTDCECSEGRACVSGACQPRSNGANHALCETACNDQWHGCMTGCSVLDNRIGCPIGCNSLEEICDSGCDSRYPPP